MLSLIGHIFNREEETHPRILSEQESENQALEFIRQEMSHEDLTHEQRMAYLAEAMSIASKKVYRARKFVANPRKKHGV